MTIHSASTTVASHGAFKKWYLAIAIGAALAVALTTAIAIRQSRGHSGTSTAAIATSAAPGVPQPATRTGNDDTPTVYLTGSADEAARLQRAFDFGNDLRAQSGEYAMSVTILTVGSAEEETRILQAITEADAIRGSGGLSTTKVVDLRAPAASVLPLGQAAFSDQEMYSQWRQAQAASAPETVSHPDRE